MAAAKHKPPIKDRTVKLSFNKTVARHSVSKGSPASATEPATTMLALPAGRPAYVPVLSAEPEALSLEKLPTEQRTPFGSAEVSPFTAPAAAEPEEHVDAQLPADAAPTDAAPTSFLSGFSAPVTLPAPEAAVEPDVQPETVEPEAEPSETPVELGEAETKLPPADAPAEAAPTGPSFFGAGAPQSPIYFAPTSEPEAVVAPAAPIYIQPVIYQQPVYANATEQEQAPAGFGRAQAPADVPLQSFIDAQGASASEHLGDIDYGPELEIIAPPVKDPFFVWKGKPIGGKPVPVQGPASHVISVNAPATRPVKASAKKSTLKSTSGIDAQTWLGEMVQKALIAGASDVHLNLNGLKDMMVMRVRIDGQMRVFETLQGEIAQKVMGIFKAGAEFASGGSFVPEEAIYAVDVEGEERKARAVLFRSQDGGDALVMRLPPMGDIRKLDNLEFSQANLDLFKKLLLSANRMLLIAGPMGSGKTTTSHAALMHVATSDRSVWTVEDPVERHLPGLTQLEVDDENGAGFEKLLPSLVRADYDTLFLGEIRDKATAAAGVRQAKAGRQVISTIHSNDNVTAVLRLIELAEDTPLSVMDAVKGVVSQRLVRRLNKEWDGLDIDKKYKGRVPIHEVLMMSDDLVEAVMEQRPLSEIKKVAAAASASTFAEDSARLIAAGVTDAAEINRVLGE
jgi:type II secretory ATPase GspE/PulE/Tfp pilus assembly ATPase PilB-like protein